MKTPMTLTESVAQAIHDWPTLYKCRTDVLHHYFCVNGNGMVWENGILVDMYGSSTKAERLLMIENEDDKIEARALCGELTEAEEARIRIDVRRSNMEKTFRVKNAKFLALLEWNSNDEHREPKAIYPLCQYACMNEVPDDVQPDWLAGVREMIFCVFRSERASGSYRQTPEQQAAQRAENIDFADKVLQSLHTRFGSPDGLPTSFAHFQANEKSTEVTMNRILDEILAAKIS